MTLPLPVDVAVDPASGRWSVDGVPMILVPQHLLTGVLGTVEEHAGAPGAAGVLRPAGYLAAWRWCEHQASHHALHGTDLVRHYLEQLTRRGWGRFTVLDVDLASRYVDVRVDHSAFASRPVTPSATGTCYPFAGWFEGAVDYAADPASTPGVGRRVTERLCSANGGDHCRFRSLADQSDTPTKGSPSWASQSRPQ